MKVEFHVISIYVMGLGEWRPFFKTRVRNDGPSVLGEILMSEIHADKEG